MITNDGTANGMRHEHQSEFAGQLLAPRDAVYDDARKVYNTMIDRRPALIARCADPHDVVRAIGSAQTHDLAVAVRGGGTRYSAGGAYVNFLMGEGQEQARAGYRVNYPRLAEVKSAYDPDNLFHINQNITPRARPSSLVTTNQEDSNATDQRQADRGRLHVRAEGTDRRAPHRRDGLHRR
jgi:hypothetical protein